MLDGLVGRAVLSEPDRVVGHDIDDAGFAESGDSHGSAHVVGEDEEGGAVGDEAGSVEGDAVANGAHSVFADSEPDVPLFWGVLLEVAVGFEERHVGGREIRASAQKTRENFSKGV